MAWIESHDNLSRHPKTRRAARMLGVSIPTMMGHLHLLWHWCLEYADDGDLSPYDADDIADAVMWEGDPDQLIDALLNCGPGERAGFLEQGPSGLIVHDWMDYAGKLVAKREEARESGARGNHERWHAQRGVFDPDCPYCQETKPQRDRPLSGGESGGESEPDRDLSHRTVPYLTKEDDDPNARACEVDDPPPDQQRWNQIGQQFADAFGGTMNRAHVDAISSYLDDGMSLELIAEALRRTSLAKASTWNYTNAILQGWHKDGITTVDDLEKHERRSDERRRGNRRTRAAPTGRKALSNMTPEELAALERSG